MRPITSNGCGCGGVDAVGTRCHCVFSKWTYLCIHPRVTIYICICVCVRVRVLMYACVLRVRHCACIVSSNFANKVINIRWRFSTTRISHANKIKLYRFLLILRVYIMSYTCVHVYCVITNKNTPTRDRLHSSEGWRTVFERLSMISNIMSPALYVSQTEIKY